MTLFKSFEDVFNDVSGGNVKIPQSHYLSDGDYPIVDQGKALIAGYTNDENNLCLAGYPVIIFGDHTKCFKYIDFDFCMGADGVKVIQPKLEADTKFLYYYLKSLSLPDAGYSMHFKYLKRTSIYFPPLPEQKRIAAILDKAELLRAKRRQSLAKLDQLTQSIFLEMFGDPVTNPKEYEVVLLADICSRVTDGTHQSPTWVQQGIPFLFISNIVNGEINFQTQKFISQNEYESLTKRCPIEVGDILYTTVGSYGNTALVTSNNKFAFQRHIAHIKPLHECVNAKFLTCMLESVGVRRQVDKVARGVAQKTVNLADLKKLIVFKPDIELQRAFAERMTKIDQLKASQRASLAKLDALFATLQHQAFNGEL